MTKTTNECKNENHDMYPYYGLAPHSHAGITKDPRSFIGSTRIKSKDHWPKNFREDLDAEGCGTYECPGCFESALSEENKT